MAGISDKAVKTNYTEINIATTRDRNFKIRSSVTGLGWRPMRLICVSWICNWGGGDVKDLGGVGNVIDGKGHQEGKALHRFSAQGGSITFSIDN